MTDRDRVVEIRACSVCGEVFTITAGQQAFFDRRALRPPKRCEDCREARKFGALEDGDAAATAGRELGGKGQGACLKC